MNNVPDQSLTSTISVRMFDNGEQASTSQSVLE